MPISKSIELFNLINSLSTAEKRNFKLYASRNHIRGDLKFIELFEILDKADSFDEQQVIKKLNGISKPKIANLKRHLYTQILNSLRVITVSKRPNVELRGLLDYAYILYDKAFYIEALKILEKAKKHAFKYHLHYMHLTIIEFEKRIESRHITRNGKEKAYALINESSVISKRVQDSTLLSNLRTYLHGRYIQNGHCQNKEEKQILYKYFTEATKGVIVEDLGPIEKIYLLQAYVWYSYILIDFDNCLNYAEQWINLMESRHELIERDVGLYLRGYHYVLSSCFHLRQKEKLKLHLEKVELFRKSNYKRFSKISQIISFQYVHSSRLNNIIMDGNFEEGQKIISRTLNRLKKYDQHMDAHRVLVFYFKIAWIYFGSEKYSRSIFYLNRIVNNEIPKLREDLQIYSRLLFLMCHYELSNYDLLKYSINSFNPYFKKLDNNYSLKEITISAFLELSITPEYEHHNIMKKTLARIKESQKVKFNNVSSSYLDVSSWLEANISNQSLSSIIKNK